MTDSPTKTKMILFLLVVLFASCEKSEIDFGKEYQNNGKFLYTKAVSFCARTPEIEFQSNLFKYDNENNLIEEIRFHQSTPNTKKTYSFNKFNNALSDSVFDYKNGMWELNLYYQYKYNRDQLVERIIYHYDGSAQNKTIYKYKGEYLEWEEIYHYFEGKWNLGYGHQLEYDRHGNVVKKERFSNGNKDKVYDTFIFTYKNRHLSTEKRILLTGALGHEKEYFYTKSGFLDQIIKDGNVIEKNFYDNGKLIETHTWYFGIDPGFSPCSGNLIYKYEY